MNRAHSNFAESFAGRALLLLGALAAATATVACSSSAQPKLQVSQPAAAQVRPAALKTVEPVAASPVRVEDASVEMAVRPSKPLTFRSRDYGVSFVYPWQYAFAGARSLAEGEAELQPKSDGSDGQFTLARIDIPAGFYPGTDFESGYFAVSLNQDIGEEGCGKVFAAENGAKSGTQTINGVEYRWVETESGGGGAASRVRDYVAFTNGTCYELELGVTTRNDRGLSREVSGEQVFRRLNSILDSVNIAPAMRNAPAQAETAANTATPQQ